jgi:hypothetical protein
VFPVVLKSLGTHRLRTELSTSKGLRLFIVNHGHGIIRQPDGSIRQLVDDNMMVQRINYIPVLSLLGEYDQKDISIDYLGASVMEGTTVEIVAISLYSGTTTQEAESLKNRTQILYYIDSNTGLVTRIDRTNYAENDPNDIEKLETRFSDYRLVSGVMIPFQQRTSIDGAPYQDLVLTSVALGGILSDSDFSLEQ